jgi:hypothetical protein
VLELTLPYSSTSRRHKAQCFVGDKLAQSQRVVWPKVKSQGVKALGSDYLVQLMRLVLEVEENHVVNLRPTQPHAIYR